MIGTKDCQCEADVIRTPELVANRPGRGQLNYRVGTHASFLDTMIARLSDFAIEVPKQAPDAQLNLSPEILEFRRFLGFLLNPFDPVANGLRGFLDTTAEELLSQYQSGVSEQELVDKVAAELAKYLPHRRLSTQPQFSSALLTPALHRLLCRGRLDPETRLLLNKLILHVYLPSVFPHPNIEKIYPLLRLTTRATSDPSIALLDGWSTLSDVLTFYQERIANEGYLRTATERKSLFELSRLVGYRPRPGVAASGFVAFTLDNNFANPDEVLKLTIPAGTQCRSTPGDGEVQQVFETSETIEARSQWNEIRPRLGQPQRISIDEVSNVEVVYFSGTSTGLSPNDELLFTFGDRERERFPRTVETVTTDVQANRTEVRLQSEAFSLGRFLTDARIRFDNFGDGIRNVVNADLATVAVTKSKVEGLRAEFNPGTQLTELDTRIFTELEPVVRPRDNNASWILNRIRNALTLFGPSAEGATEPSLSAAIGTATTAFVEHPNEPSVSQAARNHRRRQRFVARFLQEIAGWTFLRDPITSRTRTEWRNLTQKQLDLLRELLKTDPALTTNPEPLSLVHGFNATLIDSSVTVNDPEDSIQAAAVTISLRDETRLPEDQIDIDPTADLNGMTVTPSPQTQTVTAAAGALPAARFESVLRAIRYSNSAVAPNVDDRIVQFTLTDQDGHKTQAFRTLQLSQPTSADGFELYSNPAAMPFRENAAATAVDSGIAFRNEPAAEVQRARVTLEPTDGEGDVLELPGQTSGIALLPSSTERALELNLTASNTVAHVQDALRSITFKTQENPDLRRRRVKFEVTVSGATRIASRDIDLIDSFASSHSLTQILTTFCDEFENVVKKTGGTKDRYVTSLRAFVEYFPPLFEKQAGDVSVRAATAEIVLRLLESFRKLDGIALSKRAQPLESVRPDLASKLPLVTNSPELVAKSASQLTTTITNEFQANSAKLLDYIENSGQLPSLTIAGNEAIVLLEIVKEAIESLPELRLTQIANDSKNELLTDSKDATDDLRARLQALGGELLSKAIVDSIPGDVIDSIPGPGSDKTLTFCAKAVELAIADVFRLNTLVSALAVLCRDMTDLVLLFREGFIKRVKEIVENYAFIAGLGGEAQNASTILIDLDKKLTSTSSLTELVDFINKEPTGAVPEIKKLNPAADVADILETIIGELTVTAALVQRVIPVSATPTEPPSLAGPAGLPPLDRLLATLRQQPTLARLELGNLLSAQLGSETDPDRFSDILAQLLEELRGTDRELFYQAWRAVQFQPNAIPNVYAFRSRAKVFGYNAQRLITYKSTDPPIINPVNEWEEWKPADDEDAGRYAFLDGEHDNIVPGSFLLLRRLNETTGGGSNAAERAREAVPFTVDDVEIRPRTEYGISAPTTKVDIGEGRTWWDPQGRDKDDIAAIRTTVFHAVSERLELADAPILDPVGQPPESPPPSSGDTIAANQIELDDLYDGLSIGQYVLIVGERIDLPGTTGAEIARIQGVDQFWRKIPGNTVHTLVTFSTERLAARYLRASVRIIANVAEITHGETQLDEIVGSGDSSLAFQRFALVRTPLTHVSTSNAGGTQSTLELRINDVRWAERESFLDLEPNDRGFVTQTDESGQTTIITGDGQRGARVSTGIENVTATYRSGIGEAGNVRAGQIDQPPSEPSGIREVTNPEPTSGGAGPDTDEQIRANTPLGVIALDRLVSVQDYADFARNFAGVGKAASTVLASPRGRIVFVTIAGTGPTAIEPNSELVQNLRQAFRRQGDPDQPVRLEIAERVLLVLSAGVRVLAEYVYSDVELRVRAALREAFSFQRRRLGQDAHASEVIAIMQAVPGVAYVDLDGFDSVPQKVTPAELANFHKRFESPAERDPGAIEGKGEEVEQPRPVIAVNDAGVRRHLVLQGENLAELAARFGTPEPELRRINGIAKGEPTPGTQIAVSLTWPAQIAYFTPRIEKTIVLREITS